MTDSNRFQWIFVGTYGPESTEAIEVLLFDASEGTLTRQSGISGIANPSFLAVASLGHLLYAVSETEQGAVAAYRIDATTGSLTVCDRQMTAGGSPCYVSLDPHRSYLSVTNYTGANITWLALSSDGKFARPGQITTHTGHSVHPRQASPHPHSVVPDPYSNFRLVCDLGLDKVIVYRFDDTAKEWVWHHEVETNAGSGPRHLAFHPHLAIVYVAQELDSTVAVYHFDRLEGRLQWVQTVSTLPQTYTGESTAADLHVSSDGRYLYASNRGHDSLVTFGIDDTGGLVVLAHTNAGGRTPRNFLLTPDGRHILVANQDSDSIVVMCLDHTGIPSPTGYTYTVAQPVCLQALPTERQ
ncbi:MAG: lactonase family protein [Firmicutes bacterium]|nr:lactonase family protein [Bacillota bacterium]